MTANCIKSKILFFTFLLLFSCGGKHTKLYEFDPGKLSENNFSLVEIAEDILYIPLDNKYPISLIYNYYFINNHIYLSVKDIGILVFNREGKLSGRIGSIGRGPGEYRYPMEFTVDDLTETVYVCDIGNIIKVFSHNGSFRKSIAFNEYIGDIDIIRFNNSKLFLFNYLQFGDAENNWIVLDTLGQLIKTKERTVPIFWSNWGAKSGTYNFNNNLYYWNNYNDTVYEILPDLSISASFLISPGEHRLPRGQFDPQQKLSQYLFIEAMFEAKKYLVIKYFFNGEKLIAFIEKESRKSYLPRCEESDNAGIINDLDGGPLFYPRSYLTMNGREYIVGLLDPYLLKTHVATTGFKEINPRSPEKKKELEQLANSLKETDNPVLVMVRLKE